MGSKATSEETELFTYAKHFSGFQVEISFFFPPKEEVKMEQSMILSPAQYQPWSLFHRHFRTSLRAHSRLTPSKGIFIHLSIVNKGLKSRSCNILSIINLQKKRNKNFVISFADV